MRNDTIESWIASNQQPPEPLLEDILALSPMYAQQDTLHSAISSPFVTLASENLHLHSQTPSLFDAGHWADFMPYRAPECLEIARQCLATTIPDQPQRQPLALPVTSAGQTYSRDPTTRDEHASIYDRSPCGSYRAPAIRSSVPGVSGQLPAPLVYANSVFEDDSSPTSIFSYCSSNSFLEYPASTDKNGFTCPSGRPYGWWSLKQATDTLVIQPTSVLKLAHHNSRAKSPLPESGANSKSDAIGTYQIGMSQFAKLSSLGCNSGETGGCINGLLPSENGRIQSMAINEYEACFFADRCDVGSQYSQLGVPGYNMITHPPSPCLVDQRPQAPNAVHITSTPNTLSAEKSSGRHNPDSQRNNLPGHSSRRDEDLIRLRQAGIPYRDIKVKGKFTEAESTLRGRFRTLTKDKDQRVRKPQWRNEDVGLPACILDGRADSG